MDPMDSTPHCPIRVHIGSMWPGALGTCSIGPIQGACRKRGEGGTEAEAKSIYMHNSQSIVQLVNDPHIITINL